MTAGALLACGGQSEFLEDQDWTRERGVKGRAWREAQSLFTPEESDPDKGKYVLRGVRHDLTVAPSAAPSVRCTCLDVVVGQPAQESFQWAGEIPIVSSNQMVVAVRSQGAQCPGVAVAEELRRPSIHAVDTAGSDTIVVIEELPYGRPVALGAVVQKPRPGGGLYLRPRHQTLPYGKSFTPVGDGEIRSWQMCRVYTEPNQPVRGRAW